MGVVYVIVGFGVIEIGIWALVRLWQQPTYLVGLVARTLPILLIIVVFLLFASEIWEVAHALPPWELPSFSCSFCSSPACSSGQRFVRSCA